MKTTGKTLVTALLLLALALAGAHAQTPVEILAGDLSDFLLETGREVTPHMQTSAITSLEAGSAQIGNFPRMYLSLGLGAMFTDGIANVVDAEYTIDVEGILEEEAGGNDVYELVRDFLPLPVVRVVYGVGLAEGFEANLQLMTIPSALTDSAGVSGVNAGLTNVGGRLRKTILQDGPGVPALSLGVGYIYSSFNLGFDLIELESVDVGDTEITIGDGEISYELVSNSAGVDVRISEQLGPIIPYIGLASWYQWSQFEGGVDGLKGTVGSASVGPVNELRSFSDNDLNTILTAGMDLKLGFFVFFLEGSYAFSTQAPAAYTGFRFQF